MAVTYGAITLREDYKHSTDFIKSLGKDILYPKISTSDFGLGDYDNYFHGDVLTYHFSWDNMVISYANTTSASVLRESLGLYILKMEHILRHIDFAKAIFHMQSMESAASTNLFWENRMHRHFDTPDRLSKNLLIETDEWNFGYGKRALTGYLDEPDIYAKESFTLNPYPAKFSDEATRLFFNGINASLQNSPQTDIDTKTIKGDEYAVDMEISDIISYLSFKKVIEPVFDDRKLQAFKIIKPEKLNIDLLYK